MIFTTDSRRAAWRACAVAVAAAACVFFILIGHYIGRAGAQGGMGLEVVLYIGTVTSLAAADLLLAIGCAAVDSPVKNGRILAAGFAAALAASAFTLTSDITYAAQYGLTEQNGAFNALVYLVMEIVMVAACILLARYFWGRLGRQAAVAAAWLFFLLDAAYVCSVVVYFAAGVVDDPGPVYPWSNAVSLAAAAMVLVLVLKGKEERYS